METYWDQFIRLNLDDVIHNWSIVQTLEKFCLWLEEVNAKLVKTKEKAPGQWCSACGEFIVDCVCATLRLNHLHKEGEVSKDTLYVHSYLCENREGLTAKEISIKLEIDIVDVHTILDKLCAMKIVSSLYDKNKIYIANRGPVESPDAEPETSAAEDLATALENVMAVVEARKPGTYDEVSEEAKAVLDRYRENES